MENSVKAADQRIAEISAELGTQRLIQKHCDSYRLCRKVIEDCKSAKNPKAYRTKHQTEYQLHDSLKKGFRIWALQKSLALKSRNGLKTLNLNGCYCPGETKITEKAKDFKYHSSKFHSSA